MEFSNFRVFFSNFRVFFSNFRVFFQFFEFSNFRGKPCRTHGIGTSQKKMPQYIYTVLLYFSRSLSLSLAGLLAKRPCTCLLPWRPIAKLCDFGLARMRSELCYCLRK